MLSLACRSGTANFAKIARQLHSSQALIAAATGPQSALQAQAHKYGKEELRAHYERIAATTRPISPHLMIYKMEMHMIMSTLHRATGCYLSCVAYMAGACSLVWPGWWAWGCNFLSHYPPFLTFITKFLVTFPFGLHIGNGLRHFAQDFGYLLGPNVLRATHWGAFMFALTFGLGFAAWTLK